VDGQFLQFIGVGLILEVQKSRLCCNPSSGRTKKLKKGEHCHQHSGDVAVLALQDKKQVTMISTYHKDEMCMLVNKVNHEETKT
jgi:hypothetical protein